jgi:hypothetical protein
MNRSAPVQLGCNARVAFLLSTPTGKLINRHAGRISRVSQFDHNSNHKPGLIFYCGLVFQPYASSSFVHGVRKHTTARGRTRSLAYRSNLRSLTRGLIKERTHTRMTTNTRKGEIFWLHHSDFRGPTLQWNSTMFSERAPDAAVRGEALAELEDRVDVALARVREQQNVDCVRHDGW